MIKVSGLRKSFSGQAVLNGIDLDVPDGSITIIIGRSGGGKSVFLKHLLGLMRPDGGSIEVGGVDLARLRGRALDEVRKRYGVVFQSGALFDSMTCRDNVAFPLREKFRLNRANITRRVDRALAQVELEGVGDKYPEEVSGGMRKRVAIARALVTAPAIVWADEPTGNLDSHTAAAVLELLHEAHAGGQTLVLVTHDRAIGTSGTRLVEVRDGRVVADGDPRAATARAPGPAAVGAGR
jgi:phospholipid/cholesterol/gamma-HCH transport system ATP-binding protein